MEHDAGLDADGPRRILLLDGDPYLAFIAEREFPGAQVMVHHRDEPLEREELLADVVVAAIDDERLDDVRGAGPRIVLVAEPRGSGGLDPASLPAADGILLRPFDHAEFGRTVRAATTRDWRPGGPGTAPALAETHRVLTYLHDVARAVPVGSPISAVASALLGEAVERDEVTAGLLLTEELGLLSVAASFGVPIPGEDVFAAERVLEIVREGPRELGTDDLPRELAELLEPDGIWLGTAVVHAGATLGALLLRGRANDLSSEIVTRLASEAAHALSIAHLFGRIRDLAVDAERRRIAADLHDGVAQVLTHLRLELDLLAATGPSDPEERGEIERLGRVAQRGLQDLRSIIAGLRSSVAQEGLVGALRAYVRDLRSLGGAKVRLHADPGIHLEEATAMQIFRIAQEAVSNALRHSGGSQIDVTIERSGPSVVLVVEDDGRGLDTESRTGSGTGLGLTAMVDRAERIGGGLTIGPGADGGGTRVRLVLDPGEGPR